MKKKRPSVGSLSMQNYPNKSAGTVFINPAPPVPAPPVNIEAPLLSGTGAVESTVTCSSGVWTGSPTPTYTYIFYVDGVEEQNSSSNEFFVHESYDGLTITAEVTATNTEGSATEPASNSIVVGTIPVNTVQPTLSPSGIQSTGTLITINERTWDGTPPLTFEYRWLRDGVVIDGEGGKTYTIAVEDDGTVITAEVRASNAYGVSIWVLTSNQVDAVNAVAPVNTVAPSVTGTAVVGQTLSTTDGTWTGTAPITYSYQWYRGATLISGATSSTYTLVQADAGNTSNIKCVVTATNSAGSASADSNTVAQILTVRTSSFLTASAISDAVIRGALNTFDIGLISNSLDTDLFAIHPCVGGSASTMKWNFMNATDSDSAHRLLFNGSWAYSANGMTGNGANTSANAFVNPTSKYTTTNGFFGCVIGNTVTTNGYDIGFGAGFGLALYTNAAYYMYGGGFTSINRTNIAGFYCVNKNGSNVEGYFNNTRLLNSPITNTLPNLNGAIGSTGTGTTFSSNNYRFVVHGINMNQAKISALYTLITSFNSELGR